MSAGWTLFSLRSIKGLIVQSWLNEWFNDKQSNIAQNHEKLQVQVPQRGSLKSDSTLKCSLGFTFTFQQASWLARKICSLRVIWSLVKGWQVGGGGIRASLVLQEGWRRAMLASQPFTKAPEQFGGMWLLKFLLSLIELLKKLRDKNRFCPVHLIHQLHFGEVLVFVWSFQRKLLCLTVWLTTDEETEAHGYVYRPSPCKPVSF